MIERTNKFPIHYDSLAHSFSMDPVFLASLKLMGLTDSEFRQLFELVLSFHNAGVVTDLWASNVTRRSMLRKMMDYGYLFFDESEVPEKKGGVIGPLPEMPHSIHSALSKVSHSLQRAWLAAYPVAKIEQSILKANAWLLANQHKKKRDKGRFFNNWLARDIDKVKKSFEVIDNL